ncbi:hypothetical protein TSAR_004769 [Trichomalopsis sarcophagae]|uniref:C2H2-type domain-containing protein n=1 Tax=Trichomalopsis sarcophagae TaxID=543379 RepID=A0A232ENM7_9HYME|nr:hypothetical protein TSAR_004769 [Trichomalopsis sarcophagae]
MLNGTTKIDNYSKAIICSFKNCENHRPPELIWLHCPKCSDSFEKPPRKKITACERCSTPYQLQCSKCRKIFRKYMTLYCHIKAICGNSNPEPTQQPLDGRVACSECGTRFSSYENLKRHKRLTCKRQAALQCNSCPFVSKYKASMELHKKTKHGNLGTEDLYKCKWCGKTFRHSQTLKRHETYNCGKEKGFSCGHCDYKCYLKYQLKNHMRSKHERLFWNGKK